jgi:drug/metabolite transporter (DMT)-like permease
MEWDLFTITTVIIWAGSFVVVAIDSVMQGISPWFWRFAGLFGGPFTLLAYCLVRERGKEKS